MQQLAHKQPLNNSKGDRVFVGEIMKVNGNSESLAISMKAKSQHPWYYNSDAI